MCETTGRAIACGAGTGACAAALTPRTLVLAGATGAPVTNAPALTWLAGTTTAAFATGSEFVIVRVGTAVTAPFTVWFA